VSPTDAINKSQLDAVTTDLAPKLKYIKFGPTNTQDAFISGQDTVAIGGGSMANGDKALAIGNKSTAAANSVAIGFNSTATEAGTFAVGGTLPSLHRRIVNVADGVGDHDAATVGQLNAKFDEAFQVASVSNARSSGTLKSSGLLGATLTATDLIKAGETTLQGAAVIGTDNVAIGLATSAANNRALAFGVASTAIAEESVAMGQSATANAKQAVALGSQVQAYGDNSLALGSYGTQVTDSGTRSTAIGYWTVVGGTDTVALGNLIASEGSNNVVLGNKASDDKRNYVASVGSKGAERQVIFVKAGTADTDAVNVSQLKSAAAAIGGGSKVGTDGMVTLPTYKIAGKDTTGSLADGISKLDERIGAGGGSADPLAVKYDGTGKDVVTFGGTAGTVLANVAAGTVKEGSMEAVNGGQLYGAAASVAKALGGGSEVDADGTVSAPEYTVGGKTVAGVEEAMTGLDDRITTVDTKITGITNNYTQLAGDVLKWNGKAGADGAYTAAHGTQTESRIANVADAIDTKDAVNKGQMDKALAEVATGNNPLAVTYDGSDESTLTLGGTDATKPVQLKNVANAVDDNDAVNLSQLKSAGLFDKEGKALDAVVYDANSQKATVTFGGANGTVLNNVADGQVSEGSRQAVNGGQLYQLKTELRESITNIDSRVTNIEHSGGGTGGNADYIQVNPQGAGIARPTPANAGSTAGIAVGYSASASGEGASAMGDNAVAQAKDSVAIGNSSTVTETAVNSVALGNNSVADTANTVSIGSAGNERTISHLARGNADTDAATMGQMHETLTEAKAYADSRLNDVWQDVGEQIDEVNRQANRGIAAASALINVTPYVPGHTTVNAGVANYRGETALGVGVSRWSENGRVNFNAGVSAAQNDDPILRVGVGYIF